MIYTSYFSNNKNIPKELKRISISRFTPSWATVDLEMKTLAPSADLLNRYKDGLVSDEAYTAEYVEYLRSLDPFEVGNSIQDSVLLCYEKDGDFCHRNLVANWLSGFGFEIKEIKMPASVKNIKVEYIDILTEDVCLTYPDKIFVYGDNLAEKGYLGQAIIRNHPNSFGVPTRVAPDNIPEAYFSDKKSEMDAVKEALRELYTLAMEGNTIVFPVAGIGTGLSKMKEKSPLIFEEMNSILAQYFLSHATRHQRKLF